MKTVLSFLFLAVLLCAAEAQTPVPEPAAGDPAIAARYLAWAEEELAAGRVTQALAGLERGADYASVSADLLYLLAKTRKAASRPARTVLDACRAARENGRWSRYGDDLCRLLEAEVLIETRRYDEALALLETGESGRAPLFSSSQPSGTRGALEPAARRLSGPGALALRLRCRKGLGHDREFILLMKEAMDTYPRDPRFLRLLFAFCRNHPPGSAALTRELVSLALGRLPFIVQDDPELSYLAAPYLADRLEAARFVAGYRALGNPNPASLPLALEQGLLDDEQAVTELFAAPPRSGEISLDRGLVLDVWNQLRAEEGRELMRRYLLGLSGVIKEDSDQDGVFEAFVEYRDGMPAEYRYDADQDGLNEWEIQFSAGLPSQGGFRSGGEDRKALIRWERYPAVLFTDLEGIRYIPRPSGFFFTPLQFQELVSGGPLYPDRGAFDALITERSLLSFSVMTERPSAEFPGGIVRTQYVEEGISAESTWLNGKLVAEREFQLGWPVMERADLDNDGRMETLRHFSRGEYGVISASESDWDGDGLYEYAEVRQDDGTLKKYWDLDRDGTRETER
jgi:tetratricopeptide (TPR) repeat protein